MASLIHIEYESVFSGLEWAPSEGAALYSNNDLKGSIFEGNGTEKLLWDEEKSFNQN